MTTEQHKKYEYEHPNHAFHNLINISRYLYEIYSLVLRYEHDVPVSDRLQVKIITANNLMDELIEDYIGEVGAVLGHNNENGNDRFARLRERLEKIRGEVIEPVENTGD